MRPRRVSRIAKRLLDELDGGWLEVVKVQSERGYIRCPISVNAVWYSQFCKLHMRARRRFPKPRTIIKRYLTRNALAGLVRGRCETVYQKRIMEFILRNYE